MNELYWLLLLAVSFSFLILAYRLWNLKGLLVWIPLSTVIANIQVTKNVLLFGMNATLGNIVYATIFLATDIINEFYGKKEAQKSVFYGLFSLVVMTVLMFIANLFTPSESDLVSDSMKTVFCLMPRIALASIAAYLLSSLHDVWSYNFIKKKTGDKKLWLRNNVSTMISQLIDTLVFTFGAFLFVYDSKTIKEIVITTYLLKFVVATADTAVIYLCRSMVRKGKIKDLLK